jgi:hypothetical protein
MGKNKEKNQKLLLLLFLKEKQMVDSINLTM